MTLDDLSTPCLLIERSRLERNLASMQARADAQGVRLRPHVKTHKSIALARRQRQLGARGLTVATAGEAVRFARAGFDDIRMAFPLVGRDPLEAVASLRERARISLCLDTMEAARAVSDRFAGDDAPVEVLVEVNTGHDRCGVDPEDDRSISFARAVSLLPGIRLVGVLTHAGQVYGGPVEGESTREALHRVSRHERDSMLRFAGRLREVGLAEPGRFEISVGSTPTASVFESHALGGFRITEIRPGNYVFHDAMQVTLGAATLEDCALTAWATIVSRHRDQLGRERLFIDAGSKTISSDTGSLTDGYGRMLYNGARMQPLPHARIAKLSEEHGWVEVSGGSTLETGHRVRFVPNHACVCMNLHEHAFVVDGEEVVDVWSVDARSRAVRSPGALGAVE